MLNLFYSVLSQARVNTTPPPILVYFNPSETYSTITLSNTNQTAGPTSGANLSTYLINGNTTGKFYVEFIVNTVDATNYPFIGASNIFNDASYPGGMGATSFSTQCSDGGVPHAQGVTVTGVKAGQILGGNRIGYAIDIGNGKFWMSVNGSWANSQNPSNGTIPMVTWTPSGTFYPCIGMQSSAVITVYGNSSLWTYTRPTGFLGFDGS